MSIFSGIGSVYSAQQLAMLQQQAAFNAYNQQLLTQFQQRATQEFQNGLGQSPTTLYGRPITPADLANIRATTLYGYAYPDNRADKRRAHACIPCEGIRAGEIIAYRVWDIRDEILEAIASHFQWLPNTPVDGDVRAGQGVHCFKTMASARRKAESMELCLGIIRVPLAVGSVEIWGEIVEHEHGYRAQYASIRSIDDIVGQRTFFGRKRYPRLLRLLRQKYLPTPNQSNP